MKQIVVLATILALMVGCTSTPIDSTPQKTQIVATFYPLHSITSMIAGDAARVDSLVPNGVEPHDYDPTPGDIQRLSKAKAFVTHGLELATTEQRLIDGVGRQLPRIYANANVKIIPADPAHPEKGEDPHTWLSPKAMIIMAGNIRTGLVQLNPINAQTYETNAANVIADLKRLDEDFTKGLSSCAKHVVVTNHQAFGYLAHDYGFEQVALEGLQPEAEVSPQVIVHVHKAIKENDLHYILYEELADPRTMETIAKDVGATVLKLSPLEGSSDPDDTYFDIMRENLATLRTALECS